jgi:hypothetical protein
MAVPLNTTCAILYDVHEDASDILAQNNHPRRVVVTATLRKNVRTVLKRDLNYRFDQFSVYSKTTSKAQCLVEVTALHLTGNNDPRPTRNLSWIKIPGTCRYAAAEITFVG